MRSQVRSCPFGEKWLSHSWLYQPSDRWQKGNSTDESPPLQVQVYGLWLWLSGADILCPGQSQLHSSLCKVCGRSIEGDDPQRHSPTFGCVVGHDQRDSHSSSWLSICSALSWGSGQHRHRRVCRSKILLSGKSLDAENMVFRSPLNRLVHCTSSKVSPLSILCKHIFSGQPLYTMIRSSEINRLSHIQSLSGA